MNSVNAERMGYNQSFRGHRSKHRLDKINHFSVNIAAVVNDSEKLVRSVSGFRLTLGDEGNEYL